MNELPEFPVYGDGFSAFKGSFSRSTDSAMVYIPDEQDAADAITIKRNPQLLSSSAQSGTPVRTMREVLKGIKKPTGKRKSARSVGNRQASQASRSGGKTATRQSARIQSSRNGVERRELDDDGDGDDHDDDDDDDDYHHHDDDDFM
ncbi:unnamed protein product [Agarophyton chilense]